MKKVFFVVFLSLFLCGINVGNVSASPKSVVVNCLKEIKKGNYADSYTYFSSSLKGSVDLEGHVSNLKNIENEYGHLVSFSDKHPLFKNYFLDENMFKGIFSKKKQTIFKYLLTYEKGMLSLFAEVEKEDDEYKIKTFYMDTLEHQHEEDS
ncbi:MAG: hypothetical protein ACW990_18070 [Promethearchaeota archaeon]|jgi:hypothetical protein